MDRLGKRDLRATAAAETALVAALRDGLPAATVTGGPLVSIVILNRDGRDHLARCLAAIATTAYHDVEVIVVDNGSTDGCTRACRVVQPAVPAQVIRNATNRSFSDANAQGVAVASGRLICFLNNDVDPITDGWLGYMVETMSSPGAVAVGARLIYPRHRGGVRAGVKFADLSLQHTGVGFDRKHPVPIARVMGAGADPLSAAASRVVERPALTAACLLVRRDAFEAVGGFSSAYDYGIEDVDLCLKLRDAGGRLIYDGRAALWHHESATRAADRPQFTARVARNRDTYIGTWGPRIFRDALADALDRGSRYSTEPFHVAITLSGSDSATDAGGSSTARHLGDALEAQGWRVSFLATTPDGLAAMDRSVEAIVVLDDAVDIRELPRRLITLAWLRDEAERWCGRVFVRRVRPCLRLVRLRGRDRPGAERQGRPPRAAPGRSARDGKAGPFLAAASELRVAFVDWTSATRYGLRIGVTNWDVIDRWGDYHFARGLQRALERAGHPTRLHFLPDWDSEAAARDDVAVHLFGLKEARTRRGQVNILWQISHPDLATPEIYERYDHVFVASDPFAAWMAGRVAVPVTPLHQATDPERFRPEPGGPHHELLFVANSRRVHRRIVDDLAGTTRDLAIYGREWTPLLVDQRFVKGENVPNTELARYYSAADIVLNDHWDDMRFEGFLSNRLYDALACGAFVISDRVDGIEAEFDGAIQTYDTRAELEQLIDRYLDDPDERQRLAAHGRAVVLARHTLDREPGSYARWRSRWRRPAADSRIDRIGPPRSRTPPLVRKSPRQELIGEGAAAQVRSADGDRLGRRTERERSRALGRGGDGEDEPVGGCPGHEAIADVVDPDMPGRGLPQGGPQAGEDAVADAVHPHQHDIVRRRGGRHTDLLTQLGRHRRQWHLGPARLARVREHLVGAVHRGLPIPAQALDGGFRRLEPVVPPVDRVRDDPASLDLPRLELAQDELGPRARPQQVGVQSVKRRGVGRVRLEDRLGPPGEHRVGADDGTRMRIDADGMTGDGCLDRFRHLQLWPAARPRPIRGRVPAPRQDRVTRLSRERHR